MRQSNNKPTVSEHFNVISKRTHSVLVSLEFDGSLAVLRSSQARLKAAAQSALYRELDGEGLLLGARRGEPVPVGEGEDDQPQLVR